MVGDRGPRRRRRRRARHRHRGGRLGLRAGRLRRADRRRRRGARVDATIDEPARGARCLSPACTSRSSARATSAARRWRRRCSPIRSASAGWPTRCGSPAREPATGMRARAPTTARTGCCANTAIRRITGQRRSTTTICRPIWWWRWAETTSECCARWVSRPTRLRMLRSFDPRSGAHALDVEDPYYGTHEDFEEVFAVIEAALPGLHEWVDEQLAGRGIAS